MVYFVLTIQFLTIIALLAFVLFKELQYAKERKGLILLIKSSNVEDYARLKEIEHTIEDEKDGENVEEVGFGDLDLEEIRSINKK